MACDVQDVTFEIKYVWMSKSKCNVEREYNRDISALTCTHTFYDVFLKDALMNEQIRGRVKGRPFALL